MSDLYSDKLSSIKTELLVGWIFSIVFVVIWVIAFVFYFVYGFIILGLLRVYAPYGGYVASYLVAIYLIPGIAYLILMIPSILVMRRSGRMYGAAKRGDIAVLKGLDSIGWAIVALIFSGVIPGIMLLIAHSPINELPLTAGVTSGLGTDNIDKLSKLKGLLDSGVITKEEFEQQKNLLLNPSRSTGAPTVEAQLSKLKSLYDSGAINKTEYDQQREILLRKL